MILHSRFRTRRGPRRRLLCKVCGRTFAASFGTVYYRLRRSRTEFDAAIQLAVEGLNHAAIARSRGICASTVPRWIERSARHARGFEDENLAVESPVELQLDEVKSYGAGRAERVWVFNAIEVWSRLWVGARVGTRSLRNTLVFSRELRSRCAGLATPVIVTSDEFKYYAQVLRRTFGPACVYVQVENRYRGGRIVRSVPRRVIGSEWRYDEARARSEDSRRPNTAYVERLNLFARRACAYLHRRTPAPTRKPQRLADAIDLLRCYYNFVRPHGSLRFGKVTRTPAMQAGLTRRALTMREIFTWVPPPRSRPLPLTWEV